MEPRKPAAAEIVHSLDEVLATRSRQDGPEESGSEPLWAPLEGRHFHLFLPKGYNDRWTSMAQLSASGPTSNPAMRTG
jgi:hypothetical protein